MPGLSNSLRQRLGSTPDPQLHPDADLLTAYVERSLTPAEKADMVRHLAACSYCREIVALSLPEVELQPAAASPSGRFTFWIPIMRWATVAVTLAIGAALVIEEPWKKESARKTESAVNPEGPSESNPIKDASPKAVPSPEAHEVAPVGVNPSQPRANASSATPAPAGDAASGVSAASGAAFPVDGRSAYAYGPQAEAPKPATPASNQAFASRKRADTRDLIAAGVSSNATLQGGASGGTLQPPVIRTEANMLSAPVAKTAQGSETGFVVRRIPITVESIKTNSFAVAFSDQKDEAGPAKADAANLKGSRLFTIPGKVLSAGKEKIGALATRPPYGMAMMERAPAEALAAGRLHWSISAEGKLMKSTDLNLWHEAYPQKDDLLFRVVVAEGHDVWAGGNHMTLIHSWNGGVDWKKMKLGESASGDITDIHIDGGDVQVKTSNNQTWVSQDGGVTWVPVK